MAISTASSHTSSTGAAFDFRERVREIRQMLPWDVRTVIGTFHPCPRVNTATRTIHIPFWMLLKSADIPREFRITGTADPRFFNPDFLTEFANWYATVDHSAPEVFSYHSLQWVLLVSRDSEQYEKSKRFALKHEVAHLVYAEQQGPNKLKLHAGWDCVEGQVKRLFGNRFPPRKYQIKQERWCDLHAAQALGEEAGGIYFFSSLRDLEIAGKRHLFGNDPREYAIRCDINGDYRPEFKTARQSHPTNAVRIDDLMRAQFERAHAGNLEFGFK